MAEDKIDDRKPIELDPDGAVFSIVSQQMANPQVRIALAAFLDGAKLREGDYKLVITGARIVPIKQGE